MNAIFNKADPSKWGFERAAHLLRRTGFGPTLGEIEDAAAAGLNATLDRIFEPKPDTGEFEAESAALRRAALASENIADLKIWWLHRMHSGPNPLIEKATLLWHNHFATSFAKVRSSSAMLDQNVTFRSHALGEFEPLLLAMTKDVAMLAWLDGNANKKRQPNENLARELFELFSLGVGNYSEADIQEAARAFTGWHVRAGKYWFDAAQHDGGEKTVFGKSGIFNGEHIVEMCAAHPACSRFIATKLLRAFACDQPATELTDALAGRLRNERLHVGKALRALLESEAFYAPEIRMGLIKSPVDLVVGTLRSLQVRGDGGRAKGPNLVPAFQMTAELGQDLFEPPTVKGWDGGRQWISSASFLIRARFASDVAAENMYGKIGAVAKMSPAEILTRLAPALGPVQPSADSKRRILAHAERSALNPEERRRETIYGLLTLPGHQLG